MKRNYKLTSILLLLFFCSSIAYSETYYISKNGNDGNSGTMNSPWRTISKANTSLQPGDKVIIREGAYKETIKPSRSGAANNYIIYTNYENEEVVISGVSSGMLLDHNYIKVEGLKFRSISDDWATITGSYNVIANCNFEDADNSFTGWSGIYLTDGGHHNKIINNYFKGSSTGPHDLLSIRPSSYNLIQSNTFIGGLHVAVTLNGKSGPNTHNIIKDNKITNRWHTGLSVWKNSDYTIVEGNIIVDSGEDHAINYNGSERDRTLERSGHNGIQMGANNCIVRNNTLKNNGDAISLNSYGSDFPARDLRIYNNTFYKNYTGFAIGSPGPVDRNILKNNIFVDQILKHISRSNGNEPYDLKIINNNFLEGKIYFSPVGDGTVSEFESKLPELWKKNISEQPKFQNTRDLNFKLQSTSPLVDKGDFLTQATSSGSGTSLTVQDGHYFTDGHGLIEGDIIQLEGQNITARVIKKNGNTLTLDKSLTWKDGQGVSLNYGGKAPEIGAFEIDGDTPTTPSNTAPTISTIEDQIISKDSTFGPINIAIGDGETAANDLTLTANSSNQELVKNESIKLDGSEEKRSFTITPVAGKFGTTTITLALSDGEATTKEEFVLTVENSTTENTAPIISQIEDQVIGVGETIDPISFTISDRETTAGDLRLSVASSNPDIVPVNNIKINGSGESRTLTITPIAGKLGVTKITLTGSDGELKSNEIFALTINEAGDNGDNTTIPTISSISDKTVEVNNTLGISFTLGEKEMTTTAVAVEDFTLTAKSSNESVVPSENIKIEGTGTTRKLTVIPNKDKTGATNISIEASNGEATSSETFNLTVVDNSTLLIQSLTLINAETNEDILTIENGTEINLATISTEKFNVRANTSKEVNRVIFGWNNDNSFRKEGEAPFALFGDSNGDYFGESLSVGKHELSVTPYLENGSQGRAVDISFTVIDEGISKTAPFISTINDKVINQDSSYGPVNFTIDDKETEASNLTLSAISSNQNLVKNDNIELNGSGKERQISITPAKGQYGTTEITVIVSDGNLKQKETFVLTVKEVSDEIDTSPILVQSFTLINAETNEDILTIQDGTEINLSTIGAEKFNIRANAVNEVARIIFGLDGDITYRKEGEAPFALFGDSNGDYYGKSLSVGEHSLSTIPYSTSGTKGKELKVNFTIISKTTDEEVAENPDSGGTQSSITSFTLINSETNKDIATLRNGDVINLSTINVKEFNIRANSESKIEGVTFDWNGESGFNKEKEAPYTLFGDSNGDYFGNKLVPGSYTITARPIGNQEEALSIQFQVIEEEVLSDRIQATTVALNIYPNPFISNITIDLDKNPTSDFTVHIYDNSGTVVYNQKMNADDFNSGYRYNLNLSNVPLKQDEVYYLKISGEGSSSEIIRIIKK